MLGLIESMVVLVGCMSLHAASESQPSPSPADSWLQRSIPLPEAVSSAVSNSIISTIAAKSDGDRVLVTWTELGATNSFGVVWFSPEAEGRWTSRPWFRKPAVKEGERFVAELPVADLDEPIIYFATVRSPAGQESVSQPRICVPRQLDLSRPTAPRSAFVEGFEDGLWNWRNLDERSAMTQAPAGRLSGHSMEVQMPSGQRSAAVATPLVRGTVAIPSRAQGFSVWLRSRPAGATVRVLAMANVETPGQISAAFPESIVPTDTWSRFDFRFDQLSRFPLGALDQIVFEISGEGPCSVGFDDLEWTGI